MRLLYPRASRHPQDERRKRAVEQVAPWLVEPGEEAAPVPVGHTLVVACSADKGQGSLWLLGMQETPERLIGDLARVGSEALEAIKDALAAANRVVPFLWTPLDELRRRFLLPRAALRLQVACEGVSPERLELDGRSLGLSLGLGAISMFLQLPLPAECIASAELRADGQLGGVQGLELKLRTILYAAPCVRRVMVSKENGEEARRIAGQLAEEQGRDEALEIVAVGSLGEAFERCWPAACWETHLQGLMEDPVQGEEMRRWIFKLTLGDQRSALRWAPLRAAAARALSGLPADAAHRWRLAYAEAVAARYDHEFVEMPVPEQAELDSLPLPHRLAVVAHIVQHSASWGQPEPESTLCSASAFLPACLLEYTPEHLKLRGAIGRLMAACGQLQAGLAHQRAVLEGWRALDDWGGMSYGISEGFRLATYLEDVEALEFLESCFMRVCLVERGAFLHFMELHRYKARLFCRDSSWTASLSEEEALSGLRALASLGRKAESLVWPARRWHLRALRVLGRVSDAEHEQQRYQTLEPSSLLGQCQLVLIELDAAQPHPSPTFTVDCLSRLEQLYPRRVAFFRQVALRCGQDEVDWLLRACTL